MLWSVGGPGLDTFCSLASHIDFTYVRECWKVRQTAGHILGGFAPEATLMGIC